MKQKVFSIFALLLMAATGAWAKDYYAPSADEVIILNDVYNGPSSGKSLHSAIAWGGNATRYDKKAGDPNNGGQPTSSDVSCYTVKGTGQGKNITLSITGVSKVIVYHEKKDSRYIELRDGSKTGNIIGSGQKNTYYTEVELTATNQYSIFLHGTSDGSDDQDLYVYAIKLIAAPAATYSVTLAEGTEEADKWTVKVGEGEAKVFPVEGLNGGETVIATYSGDRKVKSVKAVKKAVVDPAKAYLKWDADQKKLVATEIPTTATKVENADADVNWSAGTYVVEGKDVKINGSITLSGDVNLIIKDDAKLTAQRISGAYKNLSIYGQAIQTGQLVVDNSGNDAIYGITTLEVHSAKVTATSSGSNRGGFFNIGTINVYGGSVDATATGDGYGISLNGSMDIYGGEVKAVGKGTSSKSYGFMSGSSSSTVTVYGGKLWAENADDKALKYINLEKGAGFTGKIEYSSDKSTWSETVDANAKYVRAGY